MFKVTLRINPPLHVCVCVCVYVDKVYAAQSVRIDSLMAVSLIDCMFLFRRLLRRLLRCLLRFRDLVLSDVCEASCV